MFKPGDKVIFRKLKLSNHPGPRARDIHPAPHGESYVYDVDKFWVVVDREDDGRVVVRTRRGKLQSIDAQNRNLRHATWWERLFYHRRFPQFSQQAG